MTDLFSPDREAQSLIREMGLSAARRWAVNALALATGGSTETFWRDVAALLRLETQDDEPTPSGPLYWIVTNRRTGREYRYQSVGAARRACDRMDNEYGAVCCTMRGVY
jgi:hypothetical protein